MRRHLLIAALLILATVLAYGQVTSLEFVQYDDPLYVTHNPHVRGGLTADGVRWAFTAAHAVNWHPLTWLSHMLDCELFGLDPAGHHASSLVLHAINALLLYLALHLMTGSFGRSAFVAALFALHPLRVESVAWVAERKDLLCAFFGLLAILAYVAYAAKPGPVRYLAVVILFALGLMAKPMLVTLPFVLLLLDVWPLERLARRRPPSRPDPAADGPRPPRFPPRPPVRLVIEKIPLLVLSVASSIVTFVVQHAGGAAELAEPVSLGLRLANAPVSYVRYLGKMLWPAELSVLYTHPNLPGGTAWAWWQVAGAVLVLVAISAGVLLARRRYLVVGWLWYLGTLVPVIGVVQVGVQAMADRYTYLPLVGVFVMIAWGGHELLSAQRWRGRWPRAVALLCAIAIVTACALRTRAQVGSWRNSETLFRSSLESCPTNPYLMLSLGTAMLELGRRSEAMEVFHRAVEINPGAAAAHNNLASAYRALRDYNKSIEHARAALRVRPHSPVAHANLGAALFRLGDTEAAIAHLREAVRRDPSHPFAGTELARALASRGRVAEAIGELRALVALDPGRAAVHAQLAGLLEAQGDVEAALHHARLALRIDPNQREAREVLRELPREGGR